MPDQPVARVGRAPMAPGRERSGPPERRSLAVRSATVTVMIRAAFAAAKSLKRDFGEVEQLQVSEKGPGDFVSHADIKAERTVRAELARTRPEYGFLGEEGTEIKGDGRNRWIVDPLDGTTNFLHGVPHFAISIGLERDGEIIAGVAQTAGVRRWGAAALDLAFVAAGRFDAFFEFNLSPWDVAAGLLLVREA